MTQIEVPDWVVLDAAKALHLHGADSLCSDTDWDDLAEGERYQYIGWAKAAITAALVAWGAVVAASATSKTYDRCTDPENCKRCSEDASTPHAGIPHAAPVASRGEGE